MKRIYALAVALCLIGSAAFAAGSRESGAAGGSAQTYTLKVATWHAAEHPITKGLQRFKELVESRSAGAVKVNLFPSSQLGPEDTYIDSIKKGNVEMGITGTLMGRDVPVINLGELPFLFNDWEHAKKVFFGPIGEEMVAPLPAKAGVRLLAYFADGFRIISSNTDLGSFESLRGMRLRVPNTPVYVQMARGFGANPITMAFSEVFTAIESKVVDGQENPAATIRSSRFYEVQKQILDSKHMFSPRLLIINDALYQSMPQNVRNIIAQAAKDAADYQWQISVEAERADIDFMRGQGVRIVTPDAAFKQKLQDSQKDMYSWFFTQYPDARPFFDRIRAVK